MYDAGKRQRLDMLVMERGLAETRARGQAVIQGGGVTVDGRVVFKPGMLVHRDAQIELVKPPLPYVSRGGLKLKHAFDRFTLDVEAKVAADVGASTGGFTDSLLQAGAARVYAIDVGYGQLAWKLRCDPRVIVMERTNIRSIERLPEQVQIVVIDVSFISLRHVLPHVRPLLPSGGDVVALIKPQFEAGRRQVGKGGVVRSRTVWAEVLFNILGWAGDHDWTVVGLERSPIHGPAGNVEFLAHLAARGDFENEGVAGMIERVLDSSANLPG